MRAAFLDRDGVINRKAPTGDYIKSVGELEILEGAPEAVRLLSDLGFRVIVVTNQRGISLGVMSLEALEEVHRILIERMEQSGAKIDAIYYCPHAEGSCACRKPATGMFRRALDDFPGIALGESFVIGDSRSDMEAAEALGCRRIFIADSEKERECAEENDINVANSLLEAVERFIVPAGR